RDDPLHGRAREVHPLRDLAEAQPHVLVLERGQDGRGARDHLDLAFVVDARSAHRHVPPGVLAICCRVASWDTLAQNVRQTRAKRRALLARAGTCAMVRKIALEEHFLSPALLASSRPT